MIESITVITLLLSALDRVPLQAIFDRDLYESRCSARLQAAPGGTVALNILFNGVAQRDVGQMIEAWMGVLQTYGPWLKRMGRNSLASPWSMPASVA